MLSHKPPVQPFTDKPCSKQSNVHGSVGFAIDTTAWVILQQKDSLTSLFSLAEHFVAGFLILAPFQVDGQGSSHDKKVDLKVGWK